jgi:CubicO group peptidase (beta-lactamase class C family)
MSTLEPPARTASSVESIIQEQVDAFYQHLPPGAVANGLAVGVATWGDNVGPPPFITRYFHGFADVAAGTPVGPETVFEIGSVSKTFTTTMLAARVLSGTVDLQEPAQTYYDDYVGGVNLPVYTDPATGRTYPMRMLDLADYTSGIPDKSPTNTSGHNDYDFAKLHAYLDDGFPGGLPEQPGTAFRYVNTNFGMIAELLMAMGSYADYGDMLRQLISDAQLAMPNTGIVACNRPNTPGQCSIPNLAQGYDGNGTPQPNYALPTWPALRGAGAIHATLDDMLSWLCFNMGLTSSPMNDVLPVVHQLRFEHGGPGRGQALGWFITSLNGATLLDKNGGTGGFHAWIGFLPDSTSGVVVLCNAALGGSSPVDALGRAILAALPG